MTGPRTWRTAPFLLLPVLLASVLLGSVLLVSIRLTGGLATRSPGGDGPRETVAGQFPEAGFPFVGAVFLPGTDQHTCTGSLVHAPGDPGRAAVLTAAHCLSGTGQGIQFAPGYRDGTAPYGVWTVTAAYADPRWTTGHDARHDYAVLAVGTRTPQAVGDSPELGTAPDDGQQVVVSGYVQGSGDEPVTCAAPVYAAAGYPAFDCPGFSAGTSGSPWLTGGPGSFVVRGLVGGLHQGGCDAGTSYSPPFDADTLALLVRALRGGPGDVLPAGPDDC